MTKTLKSVRFNDREKLKQIKSVQQSIPLEEFYEDGIFCVQINAKNLKKYSATYRLRDVSYLKLSEEAQKQMFFAWSAVLNSIDPGATAKLSVIKHKITKASLDKFMMQSDNPAFADIQKDYNRILKLKAMQGNGMMQEVFFTISVDKKDYNSARSFFMRVSSSLETLLLKLNSACSMLNGKERLELLASIYRSDKEDEPAFDLQDALITGSSAKNYLSPESMCFETDYFQLGAVYGRALVLHSYPTYLKDTIVSDLCEIDKSVIWSMDIIPVPMDEAVKEAEARATSVDANISRWFQKQYNNKNYAAEPPYDLKQQKAQAEEYLTDLTERDQHLMYCVVTMVHFADTKEQLDEDTETIFTAARTNQCRMQTLRFQQLDGLNTALPIGVRRIEDIMTLTTEGVAGFIPFRTAEIQEKGGYCFGQNQISKNVISINLNNLPSSNSTVLGKPGSGKSMFEKWLMLSKVLSNKMAQHEVVIIDPEREFSPLVKALGGEVIYLSAESPTHINPLDVSTGYDKGDNPIISKSEFMLSLCEQIMYPSVVGPKQRSLIDRATEIVLRDYVKNGCAGEAPTLFDFHQALSEMPEQEAKDIALAVEIYAKGSLSSFANQTNIDVTNKIICFDIHELGDNLMSLGMLILFDHIHNRMIRSRANGISTSIIIDEFYLMLEKEFSSTFFFKAWKRGRKYGCDFTGITQNVEDVLRSPNGRAIISTSELIVMMNQAPLDKEQLAELLDLSDDLQEYITNAKVGSGLLKFGEHIVPFENDIPKDTQIYKLLTTKPDEAEYYTKAGM